MKGVRRVIPGCIERPPQPEDVAVPRRRREPAGRLGGDLPDLALRVLRLMPERVRTRAASAGFIPPE